MYRITSNHHNTHTYIYIMPILGVLHLRHLPVLWTFGPAKALAERSAASPAPVDCLRTALWLMIFSKARRKKTMELWWIVCSFCLNMCGGEKKPTSGIFRRLSMALSSAASSSQTRLQTSTQHLSPRLRHECRSKMLSPALEVHRTRCQEGPHAWESIKRIKETRSNTKVWEMQWSHVESWYWSMIWKLMESFCIWF